MRRRGLISVSFNPTTGAAGTAILRLPSCTTQNYGTGSETIPVMTLDRGFADHVLPVTTTTSPDAAASSNSTTRSFDRTRGADLLHHVHLEPVPGGVDDPRPTDTSQLTALAFPNHSAAVRAQQWRALACELWISAGRFRAPTRCWPIRRWLRPPSGSDATRSSRRWPRHSNGYATASWRRLVSSPTCWLRCRTPRRPCVRCSTPPGCCCTPISVGHRCPPPRSRR